MNWRLFHHQKRGGYPVTTMWLHFVVVCFLLSALCVSMATQAQAAPVVVRAESAEAAEVSEAAVLAHRILARESNELLLDAKRLHSLSREVETVLDRLRYAHPEIAEVSARARYMPGVLLLGVKPDLLGAVADLLEGESGPVALRTANAAFDALNTKLELGAVELFRHMGVLVMHLSERANMEPARRAYLMIAGVEYAEPNARLVDGSDIEAAKTDDVWHFVVRKAWGDCLSGCIYKKMFFFTVKNDEAERIEPAIAMKKPEFREILETRRWR